jgi:hypothetical protein
MFSINPEGLLLEAVRQNPTVFVTRPSAAPFCFPSRQQADFHQNHHWFEMTGHSRSAIYEMSWIETVHENSLALVRAAWTRLTVSQLPWTGELVCIYLNYPLLEM